MLPSSMMFSSTMFFSASQWFMMCLYMKKSKKLLKFILDDGTGEDRVILSGIHEYYEPEELVGKTCIAITNLPRER